MIKNSVKLTSVFATSLLLVFGYAQANAATQWQKDHPRRAEVNGRLAKQNARVRQEVKEGEMTKAQAQQIHAEHRSIRAEERTMAAANGGGLTRAQQTRLNHQENAVSGQITR